MSDNVALVDLDGTVADYYGAMRTGLAELAGPDEKDAGHDAPHIRARENLIRNQPGFWRNLGVIGRGIDIVGQLRSAGFTLHVLTKGPRACANAWTEKYEWCQRHLPGINVNITQDKSLFYGRILVDDWPPYFQSWLEQRPNGLVIAVAHEWNKDITHPNLIRYDGTNLPQVVAAIKKAQERKPGQPLVL